MGSGGKTETKQFFVHSTTCSERMTENRQIHDYLVLNGWSPARSVSDADLIVIGTCACTASTESVSLDSIRHLNKKAKNSAKIIVAGCLPAINPEKLGRFRNLITITPRTLNTLDEITGARIPFAQIPESHRTLFNDGVKRNESVKNRVVKMLRKLKRHIPILRTVRMVRRNPQVKSLNLWTRQDPDIFYIRTSWGCLGNCSYCAIKRVTGKLKSRDQAEIIREFEEGLSRGFKVIRILAEDAGCYGLDTGTSIVELLRSMYAAGGDRDYSILVRNLNAQWLIKFREELPAIIRDNRDKFMYLHVPMQSGSDRILELMNRPYTVRDVVDSLQSIRAVVPDVKIATSIMVGFPGEKEDDFEKSLHFLEQVRPDSVETFIYSERPNTLAATMDDKVPRNTAANRYKRLHDFLRNGRRTSGKRFDVIASLLSDICPKLRR